MEKEPSGRKFPYAIFVQKAGAKLVQWRPGFAHPPPPKRILRLDSVSVLISRVAALEFDLTMRLIGKVCPRCAKPGSVLYTTKDRVVYQCPDEHQYETRFSKPAAAAPKKEAMSRVRQLNGKRV